MNEEKNNKNVWLIASTVIVLLALAFWILYWRNISSENSSFPFVGQSQSGELLVIENNINALDMNNLDADLAVMEKEINQ